MSRLRRQKNNSDKKKSNSDYSDILSRIQDIEDVEDYVKQVTYGRSGTGKTTYSATWPKPILHIDIREKGTKSIKKIPGVKTILAMEWDDIEKIYWMLESSKHEFKTVTLDNVTGLQELAIREALKREGREGETPYKNTYGTAASLMKTWLINYRDLPMHVHFIAQDRIMGADEEEGGDQLTPEVGPRVMPSVATILNAAVDIIGQTYLYEVTKKIKGEIKRVVEYRLRLGPHAYYTTKIRVPRGVKVPEYIVDPTFEKVVAVMEGQIPSDDKSQSSTKLKRKNK